MTARARQALILATGLMVGAVASAGAPARAEESLGAVVRGAAGQPPTAVRLERAMRFRREFGLRVDRDFVRALARRRDLGRSAADFGTPLAPAEEAELRRRVRQMRALPSLERFLVDRDRAHFAGIYTDQRRGGIVHVGLVPGTKISRAEIARRLPYPRRLRIVTAEFSKTALDGLLGRIRRDLGELGDRGLTVTQAGPDVRTNRVVVALERATPTAIEAFGGYGPALKLELPVGGMEARSHPSGIGVIQQPFPGEAPPVGPLLFDPFPPMYAGVDVRSPGDNFGCTSGFNQVDVPNGTYYASAASDCSELGESVWHGDHVLGTVDRQAERHVYIAPKLGVYHDAARVPIDPALRSNRVWIDEPNAAGERWRPITESTPADYLHVGDPVCKSGMGSGFECGTVEHTDQWLQCISGCPADVTYFFDQTVASLTVDSGDANYPVFLANSALGQGTGRVVNLEKLEQAGQDGVITPQELDAATEGASFAPIANVEADLGATTFVGQSYFDELLVRYTPELRYDLQENYFADSAATMTDNVYVEDDGDVVCNRLLSGEPLPLEGPTVIADSCNDGGSDLSLGFLDYPTYPDGRTASDADNLDAEGDLLASAQRMHSDIRYRDRIYGRVVNDADGVTGKVWLQYWFFYYNNDRSVLGVGEHEGDWEGIQIGLDPVTFAPSVAVYNQHGQTERCEWEYVETTGSSDSNPDRAVVYVAPASHASYFFAGPHAIRGPDETTHGDGDRVIPAITPVSGYESWIRWKGRWGGSVKTNLPGLSEVDGESPRGPKEQDEWDPVHAFSQATGCTVPAASSSQTGSEDASTAGSFTARAVSLGRTMIVEYRVAQQALERRRGPADLWITIVPGDDEQQPTTHKRLVARSHGLVEVPSVTGGKAGRVVATVVFADGSRSAPIDVSIDNRRSKLR